jgi:hypothetical protein
MKRAEVEADQMPGQDSFLDVITNIVGILILLVLVVGLRTSHSVQKGTDQVVRENERGETELRAAFTSALTSERDVREMIQKVSNARHETAFREDERAWMSENIAVAEKEIAERRAKLGTNDQQDFDVRQQLATARATLDDLTRQQVGLMGREEHEEQIQCQPTPIARKVVGKEIHVQLADDHIAIVPFSELIELIATDAPANLWRLNDQSKMERTVGPINGYRMRYHFVKEDAVGRNERGALVNGTIRRFTHCYVLPDANPSGEPAEQALAANSEFFQALQHLRPESTTITIWAYPGNCARLLQLKREVRQLGFQTAVRPMPKGEPMGGSPDGTKALVE